ncbi:MAG: acyltransferase family protein [Porphyromonadaceae bacterium]|nr:acyltransferase family protein [Porphyromonadaceae bacterium]
MMLDRQRNWLIDIIKAFLIVFVVLGHAIEFGSGDAYFQSGAYFDNVVFKTIYSFHMPLFMLTSGYLFSSSVIRRSLKDNLLKKVTTLIVPIVVWTIVPMVYVIQNEFIPSQEPVTVLWIARRVFSNIIHNLWFLWAVFYCSAIVLLVNRYCKDSLWVYLGIFCMSFFLPDRFYIGAYSFMYPFFVAGYLFQKHDLTEKLNSLSLSVSLSLSSIRRLYLLVLGCTFVVMLSFYDRDIYIYTSGYSLLKGAILSQLYIDLFRCLIGFVGCAVVILALSELEPYLRPLRPVLLLLGKHTMGIYVISEYLHPLLLSVTQELSGLSYPIALMETIIIVIVSLFFIWVIQRSSLLNRLLLGAR